MAALKAHFKRLFSRWVMPLMLLVAGAGGGWWLLVSGFTSIQELRQLERVPVSKAGAVLPGEVSISAFAQPIEGTLESYHTRTPSLYYHYTHERERRDSDGNTHWDVVDEREASVDFDLVDETGQVRVRAQADLAYIQWSVRTRFQNTVGKDRYTERRIEPGDKLFVFAQADTRDGDIALRFDRAGFYTPIVTTDSQADTQASMGGAGLFFLWGGLAAVALAVLGLTYLAQIHRLLAYLTILTLVLAVVLLQLSLTMMRQDLGNGLERFQRQSATAGEQARAIFDAAGLPWRGWAEVGDIAAYGGFDAATQTRLREYRLELALGQARLERQMRATPERWLLAAWGFDVPPAVRGIPPADTDEFARRIAAIADTRLTSWWVYLIIALGAAGGLGLTVVGYRQVKFKRLIENIPTARSIAVSCGLAETTGTVVLEGDAQPLSSPHTDSECTWFYYKVEERRRSGKKVQWVTIEERSDHVAFYCEDDEGRLAIDPTDAEVISTHHVVDRQGKRRYTETTLRMADPLYAIGMAAIDPNQPDRLILEKSDTAFEPFILSNFGEREVMLKKARRGMAFLNVAFSGVLLTLLLGFGSLGGFAATDFLAAAMAAPVYMLAMMLAMHYNDLVYLRERAQRNWANIEVSLKKRRHLIPSLERIAKQMLSHERGLQEQLAQMRSDHSAALDDRSRVADYLDRERRLGARLIGLVEQHPELKSNDLMQRLMTTLTTVETEVAYLRHGYNDAVELFNTRIASVPDIAFARLFRFRSLDYVRPATD